MTRFLAFAALVLLGTSPALAQSPYAGPPYNVPGNSNLPTDAANLRTAQPAGSVLAAPTATPGVASFRVLSASDIAAALAAPPAIGGTAAGPASFTALASSGTATFSGPLAIACNQVGVVPPGGFGAICANYGGVGIPNVAVDLWNSFTGGPNSGFAFFDKQTSTSVPIATLNGTGALSTTGPVQPGIYTVAALPTGCTAGQNAYASNGRNNGEAASAGTGLTVTCNSAAHWLAPWAGVAVTS